MFSGIEIHPKDRKLVLSRSISESNYAHKNPLVTKNYLMLQMLTGRALIVFVRMLKMLWVTDLKQLKLKGYTAAVRFF